MFIQRVEVWNYKSYDEPSPIELTSGFNVLVGQNNAGKTALLEGLSLSFSQKPHRSSRTLPTPASNHSAPHSQVRMRFHAQPAEVQEVLKTYPATLILPAPRQPVIPEQILAQIETKEVVFDCTFTNGRNPTDIQLAMSWGSLM